MEAEGGGGIGGAAARYRPPALRTLASQSSELPSATTPTERSVLPPTNFPSGFRRARAGTLPSNVQLAAQHYAAASSTLASTPGSTESFADQLQLSSVTPPATNPVRPNLRHTASVATSIPSAALGERNSRLRSGSLTLPSQQSINNAFGPSIFSSGWLTNQNGGNSMHSLDELRSVTSMDSGVDDFDVPTLDYLGLDEVHRPAATISELRNQAQAAITGNIPNPSSRARASTVSNPYRQRLGTGGSLLGTPQAEEEEMFDDYASPTYARQRVDSYDAGSYFPPAAQIAKGFKHGDHLAPESSALGSRQRAVSVGTLEDPARGMQRRASVAGLLNSGYMNEFSSSAYGAPTTTGTPSGILKSDRVAVGRTGAAASVHFPGGDLPGDRGSPYLQAPSTQGRAVSPKSEGSASQTQTPTRSLWIGNLDNSVTSEQLIHVFAPYGAIESLRLLPEKVRAYHA
jgi:protein JSN1